MFSGHEFLYLLVPFVGGLAYLYITRYLPMFNFTNVKQSLSHFVGRSTHPLLCTSATKLAALIRSKEVSVTDVVSLHIRQLQNVNGALNAVVETCFDEALRTAAKYDAILRTYNEDETGKHTGLPVFFGVPTVVKECFETAGLGWTSGLVARKGIKGQQDSPVCARMKKAGMIILGSTNVSELCMWYESDNKVYGRTNNPYDLQCTAGGSSGGAGAIVAACAVPVSLGSDVGGSIRMPSYFNGIYGHKPSGGTTPVVGQWPPSEGKINRYCQAGPMCRHAEDLWPLLNVLAGPHELCEFTEKMEWHNTVAIKDVIVSDLVVYNVVHTKIALALAVDPELVAAQDKAAAYFAGIGCQVKSIEVEEIYDAFQIWSSMLSRENGPPFRYLLANNGRKSLWVVWEIMKYALVGDDQTDYTLPALALALLERVPEQCPSGANKFVKAGQQLKQKISELLGMHTHGAIMLFPSHPVIAPTHGWSRWRPFNAAYTALFNVLEFPVTQVPMGLSASKHLPLGIQIVGPHKKDQYSIAAAGALEQGLGGWKHPLPLHNTLDSEIH